MNLTKYEVEFWPGVFFQVEAYDDEEALLAALDQHRHEKGGWPGGVEHKSQGIEYRVWVRKKESF
jgi:hypothetical protein